MTEFAEMKEFSMPEYTVQTTVRETYSAARTLTPSPRIPEAYSTFSETFSYGV